MRPVTLLLLGGLSACAQQHLPPIQPYVSPLSDEAAAQVAYDIAAFVGARAPPTDGPIAVLEPPGDTVMGGLLLKDLKSSGYTVDGARPRHHLRYAVRKREDGSTFMRATMDDASIAQLYHDDRGTLAPSGPATVLSMVEPE